MHSSTYDEAPGRGARRRRVVAGALGTAVLTAAVAVGVAQAASDPDRPTTAPAPAVTSAPPAAEPEPTQVPAAPVAAPEPAEQPAPVEEPVLPAGTYEVQVLAEGWDDRGRHLVVDRGRIVVGEPTEPGVDSTRPVTFDTGAVTERVRTDLAPAHDLRFNHLSSAGSYGPGSWADLVTVVSGQDEPMLATLVVDGQGRFTSLVEPYRP